MHQLRDGSARNPASRPLTEVATDLIYPPETGSRATGSPSRCSRTHLRPPPRWSLHHVTSPPKSLSRSRLPYPKQIRRRRCSTTNGQVAAPFQ
jgi:hypothetical protein